jgi:hypothetical protein
MFPAYSPTSTRELQALPSRLGAQLSEAFDMNRDGKVTQKEFQHCLQKHGEIGVIKAIDEVRSEMR